jgi:purine catabolism regulator
MMVADLTLSGAGARRVPRLGDLIGQESLKLSLVVGDDLCLHRPVRGVHAIELLHPGEWIDRGWVLLTLGSALGGATAAQQRDYVKELLDAGVTALGFGVGIVFDDVPQHLRVAAEELGLPLLTVAPETPFRLLISYAHELEYRAVSRRLEVHSRLTAAIGSSKPEVALAQRVSALLDRPARLVDPAGHVVASTGSPAAGELDAQHVVSAVPGGLQLTVPMRPTDDIEELEVLDVAREVMRLLGARDEFLTVERRLARAELFDDVLGASSSTNAHTLARRLLSYGVDASAGMAIVAIDPCVPTDDAVGALEVIAYGCGLSAIFSLEGETTGGETTVALVEVADGSALREFLRRLKRNWLVGVGETFSLVRKASASARIAEAALRVARARARGTRAGYVVTHAELGYSAWLLASMDPSLAWQRAARRLAVLQEQPLVLDAVTTYLDCELSVAKAAEALYIHANSLRYRLSRAELALGASLRNPEVISDLYLALRTLQGFGSQPPAPRGDLTRVAI